MAAVLAGTLSLHYVWEMAQAPLYTNFANTPLPEHALLCLLATVGDLALAVTLYLVTAALWRSWRWPIRPGWLGGAAVWTMLGIAASWAVERLALGTGRWSYTTRMPTIAGMGLSPFLQWIVIPVLLLPALRWMWKTKE